MQANHQPERETDLSLTRRSEQAGMDPRIEGYLDTICATLDPEVREDRREEMRAHLAQRVAANVELGDTPSDAVTAALEQFGRARLVAAEWRHAGRGDGTVVARCVVGAAVASNLLLLLIVIIGYKWSAPFYFGMRECFAFGPAVVAGLAIGSRCRSVPMRALLRANVLCTPIAALSLFSVSVLVLHFGGGIFSISAADVIQSILLQTALITSLSAASSLAGHALRGVRARLRRA